MKFHHPPSFPSMLAAIPGSQKDHTGFSVLLGFRFYLFLGFCWLRFPQVSLIYHQPIQTLALERCHCQVHLPFLEPKFRLLYVKKGEDEEEEE